MSKLRVLLSAVVLASSTSAVAFDGFDFAVERFEISGAVQHVDVFDDGLRDSGPTARLRDRLGTRVTESGGVLRLTDRDGAARALPPFPAPWFTDFVLFNRAIVTSSGVTTIEAEFRPDIPTDTSSGYGISVGAVTTAGLPGDGLVLGLISLRDIGAGPGSLIPGACLVMDRPVVLLQDEALGVRACQPVDAASITGAVILRLGVSTTPADPAFRVSASFSLDGGATFVAGSAWAWPVTPEVVTSATGRLFPALWAVGPADSSFHGVSTLADESRAATGELIALTGDLLEAGKLGQPLASTSVLRPGSFSLTANGANDLRTSPGAFTLTLADGAITASTSRRNALRRVDVMSGRPIAGDAAPGATCTTGLEPECWVSGEPLAQSRRAFDELCRWSLGFSALDRAICALRLFNSQTIIPTTGTTTARLLGVLLGVSFPPIVDAIFAILAGSTMNPVVLHSGSADGSLISNVLSFQLSDQQEALIGCGPLDGQAADGCDDHGLSLLGSEATAVLQSFPLIDGSIGALTNDATQPQPGTAGFLPLGGPTAVRPLGMGSQAQLPGARAPWPGSFNPFSASYDARVDGCVLAGFDGMAPAGTCAGVSMLHPLTGQQWASELAAFSWNLLQLLIATSSPDGDGAVVPYPYMSRFSANEADEFDAANPDRTNGCSRLRPYDCYAVAALFDLSTRGLPDDPEMPGLRRWVWESGAEYQITSATGRFAAFAGGTVHASGPTEARVPGFASGTPILLEPGPIDDPDGDGVASASDTCPTIADSEQRDTDGDGVGDACDNCLHAANANQNDRGGIGTNAPPDGIGDACQCGDVTGDGRITIADAITIQRASLVPPTVTLAQPDHCDVGGFTGCSVGDAAIVRRALLVPATAAIQQLCLAANP